ncbi:MAG: hypothetical protein RMM30_04750 [Armatimonadota bacterium]|nr:hypothetical protein [Armatimonadota bacterium]MDW8155877.1 hypothetical protein [Armatimonadota bacterium]
MSEQLWEAYEQVCVVELQPVHELVRRLRSGEFGPFARQEVLDLLRTLQQHVLANVYVKAQEHPSYAERAEEVADEQRRMFEDLMAEVEADWPWP